MPLMEWARITAGAGLAVAALGAVFHLQGQGVVGPESSFMYSDPDWVSHGIQVAVAGAAVFAAGIVLMLARRRR